MYKASQHTYIFSIICKLHTYLQPRSHQREYINTTCQNTHQLHTQQNKACRNRLKDGNKVEPLPRQASVYYNSSKQHNALPKTSSVPSIHCFPTNRIETKPKTPKT
ncbi:hypothetical protein QL285_093507 [Trifolium repens]|nr:hypothetical protein QL285_093507 [Trifolium repens]